MAHRHRHPEDHMFFRRLVELFHVSEETRQESRAGASSSPPKPTVTSPMTVFSPDAMKNKNAQSQSVSSAGDIVVGVAGGGAPSGVGSAGNAAPAGGAGEQGEARRGDGRERCDGADVRIFQISTR